MEHFVPCQVIWNILFYNISMNNKFAERLRELRTEKNMARSELALKLNVSTRLVSYWENGERECGFDMLIKIAEFFAVSIDFLLGRVDY